MNGDDLAILIPLWRRTAHVERVHASAMTATPGARVVFIVSAGDQACIDATTRYGTAIIDASVGVERYAPLAPEVLLVDGVGGDRGDYARKINAGYRATTEPFLFTGADDLDFHAGWYEAARWAMDREGERVVGGRRLPDGSLDVLTEPLPRIGVVGTVDLCNGRTMNGTHSTHSLVARWYADCCAVVDKPGAIYAEVYAHEYCDDEMVETAMAHGAYAHAFDSVVEHLHPNVGKAPDDETYRRGRGLSRMSRRKFLQRRRLWAAR